jgi:phosphoserine phosphatase RsbU/P
MPPSPRATPPCPRLLAARTFPPEASSAAAARATIRAALPPHLAGELRDTIVLLTSELVTNVIVHAATACRLRLSEPRSGVLRVEVRDHTDSVTSISVSSPPPASDNGRGLLLVDALAASWGTRARPSGKTVWFDIHT